MECENAEFKGNTVLVLNAFKYSRENPADTLNWMFVDSFLLSLFSEYCFLSNDVWRCKWIKSSKTNVKNMEEMITFLGLLEKEENKAE